MGRALRADAGGLVYHVLNRANARLPLFEKDGDYEAFERVLAEAQAEYGTRLLAYCIMPNHWHLVLWPERDKELSRFTGWVTLTHTQRWHAHHRTAGSGHLYQGRFKSFPIETDEHLLTVLRYVERNPLRAGLVRRAEAWRWSSLGRRESGNAAGQVLLADWPLPRPRRWTAWVNEALTVGELEAVRLCVARGQPYGSPAWVEQIVATYGLQPAMRPRGRPRKSPKNGS